MSLLRLWCVLLAGIVALWPLWAMVIDALTHTGGGFLSLGDLITFRTPAIVLAIAIAFDLGKRVPRTCRHEK